MYILEGEYAQKNAVASEINVGHSLDTQCTPNLEIF